MKVLFVTRGFPSEADPMSGNYESVQAKALAAKGCQVAVMSIKWKSIFFFYQRSGISHRLVDGVDVYECTRLSCSTRFWKFPNLNRKLKEKAYRSIFKKVVEEKGRPDIVHAHIVSFAALSIFLKEEKKLPFVITEHWTMMNKTVIPDWVRTISQVYHKADAVICVSQALADSLKKNFDVNSTVINNMVSNLFFQSSKVERNDKAFRFVACGAFRENRNKGFDILVDAFAAGQFPSNVYLSIIGDGPDRPNIERKIAENHLDHQIKLLGVKTPDEVSDILCHSDCFVLPSRLETFSIVVIEAMAKGLPVIATKCGGPETFLRQEHGRVVEKENVKELADAMNYMLAHYSAYNSEEIKKYCYNHFSQDVIADQIIGIYNQVLNKK